MGETSGQMTIEAAIALPVVVAVAVVIGNIAWYLVLCARFDRVALDMVIAHGVSPAGEQDASSAAGQVRSAIESAMEGSVQVQVSVTHMNSFVNPDVFSISPTRLKFSCTMGFRPWPGSLSIAFAQIQLPAIAQHTRTLVVDAGQIGLGGDGNG